MRRILCLALLAGCAGEDPRQGGPIDEPSPPMDAAVKADAAPVRIPMKVTFENLCMRATDIQLRFFDFESREFWPGLADPPYMLGVYATIGGTTIQCRKGSSICFGARSVPPGTVWGVDIDGFTTCQGPCCVPCGPMAQPVQLSCL